jgi:polysaccharide biosynthesis/export protein
MKSFACLLLVIIITGCGPAVKNPAPVGSVGTKAPPIEHEYRIRVGDQLSVKLFYNPELNHELVVRPDGKISLQLLQEVVAAGLTPAELNEVLKQGYSKHLEQPEITVVVNSFAGHKVYVGGEVSEPGVRELVGPTTVLQAVMMSRGFRETAKTDEVVVIRRGDHNQPIIFTVNTEKIVDGTGLDQDVNLIPYDTVLVPRSNIANVNLWIRQYLREAVLGVPRDFASLYLSYRGIFVPGDSVFDR